MYRLNRLGVVALAIIFVLVVYAGSNWFGQRAERQPTLKDLALRVDALESQVGRLEYTVSTINVSAATETKPAVPSVEKATPAAPAPAKAVVAVQYLNVRREPSAQSVRVGVLQRNAVVEVVGRQGDWSKVKFKTVTGWVLSQFLRLEGE